MGSLCAAVKQPGSGSTEVSKKYLPESLNIRTHLHTISAPVYVPRCVPVMVPVCSVCQGT